MQQRQSNLDNKIIFKKILPFLAIFVFVIGFSFYQFFGTYGDNARAANEGIAITLTNQQAPLQYGQNWSWLANITANKHIGETVNFDIKLSWCKNTSGSIGQGVGGPCSSNLNPGEFQGEYSQIKSVILSANQSVNITHQTFGCGRLSYEVSVFDGIIAKETYDTGINCNENSTGQMMQYTAQQLDQPQTQDPQLKFGDLVRDIIGLFNIDLNPLHQLPDFLPDINLPDIDRPDFLVGAASTSRGSITEVATLMDELLKNCADSKENYGRIRTDNISCIDSLNTSNRIKEILKDSVNLNGDLQCVGKARADVAARDPNDSFINQRVADGAKEYIYKVPGEYNRFCADEPNSPLMRPGDIMVWDDGKFGHVAMVIGVNNTGNKTTTFTVNEANMGKKGAIRNYDYNFDSLKNSFTKFCWLRKK